LFIYFIRFSMISQNLNLLYAATLEFEKIEALRDSTIMPDLQDRPHSLPHHRLICHSSTKILSSARKIHSLRNHSAFNSTEIVQNKGRFQRGAVDVRPKGMPPRL
jgi:hypothetical protein